MSTLAQRFPLACLFTNPPCLLAVSLYRRSRTHCMHLTCIYLFGRFAPFFFL
ncbi:hypothetical protein HETIRDRAFT_169121 [Heterobasidion irregulare TC 32-1]|uniref:Uncharacterized protein n=1 Tax=Heterobasidion irregulare (strain TC 32-1) TaxID=747525 RepID=W4K4T2_HETIT|nr:uncharacterized protein HETIRDRAFT_169121 [Heterobasidion irregulare TC 32-1]ETW80365.1 hypothetical protein HETIRDRAFT_169121 [Heterobasidion irregulare TC 32-1]